MISEIKKTFGVIFLMLMIVLVLGAKEEIIKFPGKFTSISAFKGKIYLIDSENVKILKMTSDFKEVMFKSFFGEGPGELRSITGLEFSDDSLYVFSEGKYLKLSHQGELLDEGKSDGFFVTLSGGNKVFSRDVFSDDKKLLKIVLQADTLEKEIFSFDITPPLGYFASAFTYFIKPKPVLGGRFFAVLKPDLNASVEIFSESGNLIDRISPPMERIPVSREYRERFFSSLFSDPRFKDEGMQSWVRENVYFPKNFPVIQDFYVSDQNCIFIKTFKRKGNDVLFYSYNPDKKKLTEIWLTDQGIDLANQSNLTAFSDGRYYYLYYDDEGEYRVFFKPWQ